MSKPEPTTEVTATPAAGAEPPAAPAAKRPGAMLPMLTMLVLMPAISYGLTEFVLIPKVRAAVGSETNAGGGGNTGGKKGTPATAAHGGAPATKPAGGGHDAAPAAAAASGGGGHGASSSKGGKESGGGAGDTYSFENIVVNLAGAQGTRYLKSSFTLSGSDGRLAETVKANRQQLLDLAIGVLSARTVNDLEDAGAKNLLRAELTAKFNQALGADLVEQIYFSEFVVQ